MREHDTIKTISKNMFILASGTGVGKLIGILSIPLITRIYSPDDLGILSIFIAVSSLLVPFTTLKYSLTIPLPRSERTAIHLTIMNFTLLLIITLSITFVLSLFNDDIFNLAAIKEIERYWWLIPLYVFFLGMYEILNQWAIRKKLFRAIAQTKTTQSLLGESTKILLGLLSIKPLGLILGYLITQAGGIYVLSRSYIQALKENAFSINKDKMIFLLHYYRDFPKYRLPSQLLLMFSMQSPLLFSAWLYGTEITGQLGLAFMALGLPIALLGYSLGQAYYSEIAQIGKRHTQRIHTITLQILKKLLLLSVIPVLLLLFFGKELFGLVFGNVWEQAGEFSSILSIYLLFQFISAPLVNIFNVYNQQLSYLKINILRSLVVLGTFFGSDIFSMDVYSTLWIYTSGMVVCYLYTLKLVFNAYKVT